MRGLRCGMRYPVSLVEKCYGHANAVWSRFVQFCLEAVFSESCMSVPVYRERAGLHWKEKRLLSGFCAQRQLCWEVCDGKRGDDRECIKKYFPYGAGCDIITQIDGKSEKTDKGEILMKHVKTLNTRKLQNTIKTGGCGECQTSCQSACKTSCTVGNQTCEKCK